MLEMLLLLENSRRFVERMEGVISKSRASIDVFSLIHEAFVKTDHCQMHDKGDGEVVLKASLKCGCANPNLYGARQMRNRCPDRRIGLAIAFRTLGE